MKPTNQIRSKSLSWIAASFLVISLAGCTYSSNPPSNEVDKTRPELFIDDHARPDSPQKTYLENRDHEMQPSIHPIIDTGSTEVAASEDDQSHSNEADRTKYETFWNAKHPHLYRIALGDSAEQVQKKFGEMLGSYLLYDENEIIQVWDYTGFSVGMNSNHEVVFVEVYGSDLGTPTGLGELSIGDDPAKALEILGKPDTQSSFLLTYSGTGALLKLDLDPVEQEIVAIKLFASE